MTTQIMKGNPLPLLHGLLFLNSSKGSFIIYTIPAFLWYIPQPLLHHLWSTDCSKEQANEFTKKGQSADLPHHEPIFQRQLNNVSNKFKIICGMIHMCCVCVYMCCCCFCYFYM